MEPPHPAVAVLVVVAPVVVVVAALVVVAAPVAVVGLGALTAQAAAAQ
jgi:hypothetical protein